MIITIILSDMQAMVKRDYTVDIKLLASAQKVYNYVEDVQYACKPGDVIIRGTVGEEWMKIEPRNFDEYVKMDGSEVKFEDLVPDQWTTVRNVETSKVTWMVRIPIYITCDVRTENGECFKVNKLGIDHGAGDYIACFDRNGKPTFEWGAWVVNGVVADNMYRPK